MPAMLPAYWASVNLVLAPVQRTTVAVTNRAGDTVAQFPASIVGTDAAHDLAVLRIDAQAEDLQPVRWQHIPTVAPLHAQMRGSSCESCHVIQHGTLM